MQPSLGIDIVTKPDVAHEIATVPPAAFGRLAFMPQANNRITVFILWNVQCHFSLDHISLAVWWEVLIKVA
jgi:hypothetical protein